jgi:pimeloyl-ACP methyl ester carboxylesterase
MENHPQGSGYARALTAAGTRRPFTRHSVQAAGLLLVSLLGLSGATEAGGIEAVGIEAPSAPAVDTKPILIAPGSIDLRTPPGRLVPVNGRPMHLFCVGEGVATVVLDAGLGGFSLEWLPVQTRLADHLRVCSYDRSGYGWSGSRIGPRTSSAIVEELHDLLDAAGEPGPYLLVGHSFGGYTAQLFAKRYPAETAGLVLVDASHPEQHQRFPERASRGERAPTTGGRRYTTATPTIPEGFPTAFTEVAYHLMYARKAVGAQRRELADFDQSGQQVSAAGRLPDLPLVVLTRGKRVWPTTDFGTEMESAWTVLQNELAHASNDSAHWIARSSGHYVHLDEPALVAEAIDALVAHIHCGESLPDRPGDAQP